MYRAVAGKQSDDYVEFRRDSAKRASTMALAAPSLLYAIVSDTAFGGCNVDEILFASRACGWYGWYMPFEINVKFIAMAVDQAVGDIGQSPLL